MSVEHFMVVAGAVLAGAGITGILISVLMVAWNGDPDKLMKYAITALIIGIMLFVGGALLGGCPECMRQGRYF